MTHHDDDRHQLIPDTARAPREDDQASGQPMDSDMETGDASGAPCWTPGRAAGSAVPIAAGGMRSDVRQGVGARVARYAEAIDAATIAQIGPDLWEDEARAVMAVADAEQEQLRRQLFADVAGLMNDRADMWERDGSDPCQVRVCRNLANAYRTYAEGVGVPSMDSLRRKRREAEARLATIQALVEAAPVLAHPNGYPVQAVAKADLLAALDGAL